MRDGLQQAAQALAQRDGVTRDIAIFCAAALIFILAAEWLLALVWRWARLTRASVARMALVGLVAYLVSKALTGLIVDPRPYIVAHAHPLIPLPRDNGFPSDHTLLAALLTASLWWIDRRLAPVFMVGTLLVMLGRLAVGAHHTEDVVGSVVIVAVVALGAAALRFPPAWDRPLLTARTPAREPTRHDALSDSDGLGA